MAQNYGIEAPPDHGGDQPEQPPARYLVLIDSASSGTRQARLFGTAREQLAQFDASATEVQRMTEHLVPSATAAEPEWNAALAGHSAPERASAQVYVLDV